MRDGNGAIMTSKRTFLMRLTVVLVLVAMLMPVFAACGGKKDNKRSYTITYHLNGGAFADDADVPEKYRTGDEAATLPTPTKEGALFLGWYDVSEPNTETDTKYTKVPTDQARDLGGAGRLYHYLSLERRYVYHRRPYQLFDGGRRVVSSDPRASRIRFSGLV